MLVRESGTWSRRDLADGDSPARPLRDVDEAINRSEALIVHYNPFSWGRWGVAPELLRLLGRVRLRRRRPVVGVLAHERYVDMLNVRWTLMGAWQRAQFLAILRCADVAWSSTEAFTDALRGQTRARVAQIPICSNLPDRRAARDASRARLGAADGDVVVATFGTGHPSQLTGHVEGALRAVADVARTVIFLNLGAGAPPVAVPAAGVRVVAPGRLDAVSLAEHLAAADLYLAPFVDGVSGRRTTLMAALQHGLAVVGTDGHLTDTILRDARDALLLSPSRESAAFAVAAGRLATDPGERARRGAKARRLYETSFDWPSACRAALSGLTGPSSR
jgi:glycosyltransferase involved in cell wall biosynthesis